MAPVYQRRCRFLRAAGVGHPLVEPTEVVFDDMEHGNPFGNGWFTFGGSVGGGGIDPNGGNGELDPVSPARAATAS